MTETDRDNMRELLLQLLDDELDEAAARELNEILRVDAALRSDLARLMLQRSHLSQIARELQTTLADQWEFYDESRRFFADERDMWITLSIRIAEGM